MDHDETVAFIMLWSYFSMFAFITPIAFVPLILRLTVISKPWKWDLRKAIHFMVPLGLFWRLLWISIVVIYYYTENINYLVIYFKITPVQFLFGRLPNYWNFSEYLLVWLLWAFLLNKNRIETTTIYKPMRYGRIGYIFVNMIMYSLLSVPVIWAFACSCTSTGVLRFEGYFSGSMNLLMSLLFFNVGPRMYKQTKYIISRTSDRRRNRQMKKVALLSVMCCIIFLLRAIYFLADQIHPLTGEIGFFGRFVFLIFLEMIPEVTILIVLGKSIRRRNVELSEQSDLLRK